MAKKDMSFIKMVDNDEDFQREVYDHGQDNLLVSARHPPESLVRVCADGGSPTAAQWSTSTPRCGDRA